MPPRKPVSLPYVALIRAAGRVYTYYRRDGRMQRLPAIDAPDFLIRYHEIHAQFEAGQGAQDGAKARSIRALVERYRQSAAYRDLAPASRSAYAPILNRLSDKLGDRQAAAIRREHVMAIRDKYAHQPRKANHYITVLRQLFRLARLLEWRQDDPTELVDRVATPGEYAAWSLGDVTAFLASEPAADLRLAVMLALHTGQRISDVVRMAWTNIQDGGITVRQKKTGKQVFIPFTPDLSVEIERTTKRAATILTAPRGGVHSEKNLQKRLRAHLDGIGITGRSLHGLRKTACIVLAHNGCSTHEIASITGQTLQEVERYTRAADQVKLARSAIAKFRTKS